MFFFCNLIAEGSELSNSPDSGLYFLCIPISTFFADLLWYNLHKKLHTYKIHILMFSSIYLHTLESIRTIIIMNIPSSLPKVDSCPFVIPPPPVLMKLLSSFLSVTYSVYFLESCMSLLFVPFSWSFLPLF